jgi:hypothetical protein
MYWIEPKYPLAIVHNIECGTVTWDLRLETRDERRVTCDAIYDRIT